MSGLSKEERDRLPESAFAFPRERKEPLIDARHVRDAIARFDQVQDVTNEERDEAWRRIQHAAKKFAVDLQEKHWQELFSRNDRPLPKE
jgi:cell division protein FtsX